MNIDKLIKYATLEKNSAKKEAYRAVKAKKKKNQTSKNPKPEGKIIYTYNGADVIQDIFYSPSKRDFVFTDDVNLTLKLRT